MRPQCCVAVLHGLCCSVCRESGCGCPGSSNGSCFVGVHGTTLVLWVTSYRHLLGLARASSLGLLGNCMLLLPPLLLLLLLLLCLLVEALCS